MRVRRLDAEDLEPLAALHVRCWQESYPGILPDEVIARMDVPARRALWQGIFAAGEPAVFGLEEADGLAAFGAAGPQREALLRDAGFAGEVMALYVRRASHGRGHGRALMRAMARSLLDAGTEGMGLWVLEGNARAEGFYRALGGEELFRRAEPWEGITAPEIAFGWRDLWPLAAP